jgi:flagellar biosynthesis protein FliP
LLAGARIGRAAGPDPARRHPRRQRDERQVADPGPHDLLGLLPVLVMMMTSFTRFVIVLSLLRQALGLQQGLPSRIITGIALILTLLVMRPIGEQVWNEAFLPYDQNKIGLEQALKIAEVPLSRFMLAQTSKSALAQVAHLAGEAGRDEARWSAPSPSSWPPSCCPN